MELDSEVLDEFLMDDSDIQWDDHKTTPEDNNLVPAEEQQSCRTSNCLDDVPAPTEDHLKVLSRCFGHKDFRPLQWKIINSLINERRDNCAIMSTGYGKSLCYQFPSVYCGGVTIVISPLISLMEDQVLAMTVMDIPACLLGTAQTKQAKVIEDIVDNKYSLVYATPEFCTGDYGREIMKEINEKLCVTLIAVDEAHCVSTWGHDFRFQYRELGMLRNIFPHTPILATTATATPNVKDDIIRMLRLRKPLVTCSGFNRPNLYFTVDLKGQQGEFSDLRKLLERSEGEWKFSGSTIIYCITRKQVEKIAEILKLNGIKCMPYHAGLSIKVRKETHEAFVRDKIDVIAATIAFGMGIDKPDVRNIIHYGASASIEAYYQEVGRAGRDGLPAMCHAFFKTHDFEVHRRLREDGYGSAQNKERKEAMANEMLLYLNSGNCRRQFILNHFENKKEQSEPKRKCCDNCTRKLTQVNCEDTDKQDDLYDLTDDTFTFLSAVDAMGGRFGVNMYVLFLRGSQSSKLYKQYLQHVLYGSGKYKSEEWWKSLANLLLLHKFLIKTTVGGKVFTIGLTDKGKGFISQHQHQQTNRLKLAPTQDMLLLLKQKPKEKTEWAPKGTSSSVSVKGWSLPAGEDKKEVDQKLYRLLMNKRTELASENDCMPYMIASNQAVSGMASHQPLTLKQLLDSHLEGFTEAKVNKFGKEFLNVIRLHCGLNPVSDRKSDDGAKSIEDILKDHPLPDAKIGGSAFTTWSLFSKGKTVDEIAQERKYVKGTIITHLVEAMKAGLPVRLKDVGVTTEIKRVIMDVISKLPDGFSRLIPVKDQCPPEITFDQIRTVSAYIQVREHIKNLGVKYIEIEDEPYRPVRPVESNVQLVESNSNHSIVINEQSPDQPPSKDISEEPQTKKEATDETDDSIFDCLLDSPPPLYSQEQDDNLSILVEAGQKLLDECPTDIERMAKRIKTDDQDKLSENSKASEISLKVNEKAETLRSTKKSDISKFKKAVPPWLSKKRIA